MLAYSAYKAIKNHNDKKYAGGSAPSAQQPSNPNYNYPPQNAYSEPQYSGSTTRQTQQPPLTEAERRYLYEKLTTSEGHNGP